MKKAIPYDLEDCRTISCGFLPKSMRTNNYSVYNAGHMLLHLSLSGKHADWKVLPRKREEKPN